MTGSQRWFPWLVVVLAAAWLGAEAYKAATVADAPGTARIHDFGRLPVVFQGRAKPYDTLARNSLLIVSDRQTFYEEVPVLNEKTGEPVTVEVEQRSPETGKVFKVVQPKVELVQRPAIRWLLDVITGSRRAFGHKVFRIENREILDLLGLEERRSPAPHKFRYAISEFRDKFAVIDAEANRARRAKPRERDTFDRKILEFANQVHLFQRLIEAHGVPPIRSDHVSEDWHQANQRYLQLEEAGLPHGIPPRGEENWKPFARAALDAMVSTSPHPALLSQSRMFEAYRGSGAEGPDAAGFNASLDEYRVLLKREPPPEVSPGKLDFEVFFNGFEPFYHGAVLYVFAFVLCCFSWLGWTETLRRSAFWLIALLVVVHTAGLTTRIYLSGYPPVTNLYGSAVFIGWGAVVFGLVLEFFYRIGVGNTVAAVVGFLTLLVAHFLAGDGDTMEMMQAVLDTQFWLATHVVAITLGYTAAFVAGAIGVMYVLKGNRFGLLILGLGLIPLWIYFFFYSDSIHAMKLGLGSLVASLVLIGAGVPLLLGRLQTSLDSGTEKEMSRMIYGTLGFAVLFSFVGTVLGGLWADDSWGRFWGWDPKENGALIIVLWVALTLHARWAGLVRHRGMAVLSIFGNVVTAWSWFGVNQLSVGLHSYGFTDSATFWLILFVLSQILILFVGLMPRSIWQIETHATTSASRGGTVPIPAPG
ncbi:MAG: cytochrome c biogenesis protein CcsA [Phycisphaerae bacterium]|nr:cytochrome c biogenesis protein CcsA [Phycisphaerae bacterium]